MSEIQSRVDVAFSAAVQEQLQEQREMRGLVARVEASLVALSDGMVDMSGSLRDLIERSLPMLLSELAADIRAEVPNQAVEQTSDPVDELIDRLTAVADRLDDGVPADTPPSEQTTAALAELHEKMQADADAVLDALAARAEEVLAGVGKHGDSVLSSLSAAQDSLRTSLTEALQQVQGDSLDRLNDIAVRLIALGPRLERQGSDRIAELQARFESLEAAVLHQVGDLKGQTTQTQAALSTLAEQLTTLSSTLEKATPAVAASVWDRPGESRGGDQASHHTPPAPPPPPAWVVSTPSGGHTCPHCGYVARTAPGLAAHRANCPRRHVTND